jgi:isocitrate/isopropylmalate dehydrogenase
MMMDHLNQTEMARLILDAIEEVLIEGKTATLDLGGKASTVEMGDAVVRQMRKISMKSL